MRAWRRSCCCPVDGNTSEPKASPPLLWGDGALGRPAPSGSLQRPLPCPPTALLHAHLGLLQPVVEAPEVLGEELGAYGLPVDADPLPHLHQVGRAAGRPVVIGTPFPSPPHLSSETQI